jgi:hypothetical protein
MTFDAWLSTYHGRLSPGEMKLCREAWDAATSSERDRCAQIVWEYRGMCVSDESARALMAEVRRER